MDNFNRNFLKIYHPAATPGTTGQMIKKPPCLNNRTPDMNCKIFLGLANILPGGRCLQVNGKSKNFEELKVLEV